MSEELELAMPEKSRQLTQHQAQDPEGLLRYAIERGANVETIERLMNVRRELKAEQAKAEFDSSMAKFQAESPIILKNKNVTSMSGDKLYSYAPLEQIIAQVKSLLQKHGFSYTLDTDVESKDGWVIAKCRVVHSAGHSETSIAKFPLGAGTKAMSTTQIYAAALTFASRRVFCNAFGLVPAGEDIDGITGRVKPTGPSTLASEPNLKDFAKELWDALKTVRGPEKNWTTANRWMWNELVLDDAEAAPNLTPDRFRAVTAKAKAKIEELSKK